MLSSVAFHAFSYADSDLTIDVLHPYRVCLYFVDTQNHNPLLVVTKSSIWDTIVSGSIRLSI